MSFLTELLGINDNLPRTVITGGQTQGFVQSDSGPTSNPGSLGGRKRDYGGVDYAHKIRQQEDEKDRIRLVGLD